MNISKIYNQYIKNRVLVFIVIIALIWLGIYTRGFGLDMIILTFFIFAVFMGKTKEFLKDWGILLILFWLYETLRGLADNIGLEILHRPLVVDFPNKVDTFMFSWVTHGQNLNYWLQQHLPPSQMPHAFLVFLFFFYTMFFWYWAGIGFFLWLKNKKLFYNYMKTLLTLNFVAVIIFTLFPSAPPWYAASLGKLPHLDRIMWSNVFPNSGISYIHFWDQNYFAAIPSLHFSWPLLASIYLIKYIKSKTKQQNNNIKSIIKRNLLIITALCVPLIILFSIVYGAEHYVFDAIVGGILVWGVGRIVQKS